jgi:DNA replication and repair protein RecF
MTLRRLHVTGLRILRDARLEPVPGLNVIHGLNGAGKTSVLEAIHLLATGHSFRTRQLAPLLGEGCEAVQVAATLQGEGEAYPVGIRKSAGETLIRIRGRSVSGLAELARQLPVQVIHPDSHLLIAGPPGQRRAFLDWGAFHRDPGFQDVWLRYRRLLQQRNAALRSGADERMVGAWDEPLAAAGAALDSARQAYVRVLEGVLEDMGQHWPQAGRLSAEYRRGWPAEQALAEILGRTRRRDRGAGFTQAGPHRAEMVLRMEGRAAADVASRGQQKSLVLVLKLAQARVMWTEQGRAPVMLVDDLPSELDVGHRERVMGLLRELGGQVFVTAIDAGQVDSSGWASVRMFHVEHGRATPGPGPSPESR